MADVTTENTAQQQMAQELFNYAVDRADVKEFMRHLPRETACSPTAVEYELQLLKIISTGWALSFYMANSPLKDSLAEKFWLLVHEFSASLSETTELMTGHDIDYFQALQSRLGMYVSALDGQPEGTEPASAIGPEFARCCGDAEDIFTVMIGSRMFVITITRINEYLEAIHPEQSG